jgi:hypothetical protein
MYLTFTGHTSLYKNGTSPLPETLPSWLGNGKKLHNSEVACSYICSQLLSADKLCITNTRGDPKITGIDLLRMRAF